MHKAQLHTGELVAVKVQYGDALATMKQDLVNVRAAAAFLSKTDLNFDLVSAVDELAKQIELEFDFVREAEVMDTIGQHLQVRSPAQQALTCSTTAFACGRSDCLTQGSRTQH